MKEEDIEKVLAAMDKAVEPAGHSRFEEALAEEAGFVVEIGKMMTTLSNREATREWLRSLPESETRDFIQHLPHLAKLAYAMRRLIPAAAKEVLPHDPGGRPRAGTPKLRRQICREIGDFIVQGVPLSAVYKRLGQRHHVSSRTIQRIWNERKPTDDDLV